MVHTAAPAAVDARASIRPATDADGPAIAAVIAAIFADYANCPFLPHEFPELEAPATHYAGKGGRLWVGTDAAGTVVASLAVSPTHRPDACELFKVYVARDWRGRGLAPALLDLALGYCAEQGARRLLLWTDTRFVEGHRFYRRHGFRRMPGIRALHDAADSLEYPFVRDVAGEPPR